MITKMKNEWKINPKMNSPALKHTHTHLAIYLFSYFLKPPHLLIHALRQRSVRWLSSGHLHGPTQRKF